MRVLVLHNHPTLPAGHADAEAEHEVVEVATAVAQELRSAGHCTALLGIHDDPRPLLQHLDHDRPDVVFNLFEGTAAQPHAEAYVAGLLEWLRIPFTGCPSSAMVLARDKPRAKLLLQGAGLPTPRFLVIDRLPLTANTLGWPVIVKPAAEDASVGLDQGSVVTNQESLAQRVALLLERYSAPVLVEEFIPGREFNVGVIENPDLMVLPVAEIIFKNQQAGRWPIVTYASKWHPGSEEDLASLPRCPADVPPALAAKLSDIGRRAFTLFGCRDYARIDIRVNDRDQPFILEVNPNPSYHPTAGLAQALKAAGITHADFTCRLVNRAHSATASGS